MEQFQKGFPDTVVDLQLVRQQALDKLRNIFPNKEKVKIDWGVILKEKLPKRLRKEKIKNMRDSKLEQMIKEENIQVDLQKFVIIGVELCNQATPV